MGAAAGAPPGSFRARASVSQNPAAPALAYSTYLGGRNTDRALAITVDDAGNAYIAGSTSSTNFPQAAPGNTPGPRGFITKLSPNGSQIIYTAIIRGVTPWGIAVDSSGAVYVTGQAEEGFVTTANALQPAQGGRADAFILKLNPAGSAVVYATYLGGDAEDLGKQVAVDASGNACITGYTFSTNFPTHQPWQSANRGASEAFIAKINPAGSALVFSTYLGGEGFDYGSGLALQPNGTIYVVGRTDSSDFPTANAFSASRTGPGDAFVAMLNNSGQVVTSTYLGGTGLEFATGVAADPQGNVYILGATSSTNFPTIAAWQPAFGGGSLDMFLAKLAPDLKQIIYATYLGGTLPEYSPIKVGDFETPIDLGGLAVDSAGNAYIAGSTQSGNFPIVNGLKARNSDYNWDGFVARFNSAGALVFSTFLGGEGPDNATGLAIDKAGAAYVSGYTSWSHDSPQFPTTPGAWQSGLSDPIDVYYIGEDAFVSKLATSLSAQSLNDNFADRLRLAGKRLTTWSSNLGFTREGGEPAHAGNPGGHSAWWSWIAPADGTLTITTEGSDFDTLLAVYTGTSVASLTPIAGNDNAEPGRQTSRVKFSTIAGRSYEIAVDGNNGASGFITLNLTFGAPVNDDLQNASALSGAIVAVTGSTVDATAEPGEQEATGLTGGKSIWWSWMAPTNGIVTMSTEGSDFTTSLGVFTDDSIADLQLVLRETTRVTFKATAGTLYRIAVDGFLGTSGEAHLAIRPGELPPNDDFANRIFLTGALVRTNGSNFDATPEPGDPDLAALFQILSSRHDTVWWAWTAPTNGTVLFSTAGSERDTRLAIFTGDALSDLQPVAANNDAGPGITTSRIILSNAVANVTYQILVDVVEWEPPGPLKLNISLIKPPVISDARVEDGHLHFRLQGSLEQSYTIEVSPNLSDPRSWLPVTSMPVDADGNIFFVDPDPMALKLRFYRAVENAQ